MKSLIFIIVLSVTFSFYLHSYDIVNSDGYSIGEQPSPDLIVNEDSNIK